MRRPQEPAADGSSRLRTKGGLATTWTVDRGIHGQIPTVADARPPPGARSASLKFGNSDLEAA
jgi:hypothetical protein